MKKTFLCLLLALCLCLPAVAETYTVDEFILRFGEVLFERIEERLANYDPSAAQTGIEPLDEPEPETAPAIEYNPDAEVITFNGGSIKLSEVMDEYRELVALYEEFDMLDDETLDYIKNDALSLRAERAILEMKAKELGVYESTPEELAAAEEEAQYWYEDNLSYYMSLVDDGSMSEDELRVAAEELMAEEGITYEGILDDTLYMLWSDRLYNAVTADVTVSEALVQEMYEIGVSDAMEMYADDPEMFEYDYSYGVVFYRPDGFREVEYMQLPYSYEEYDMSDEDKLASLNERYGDIIARAQDGEDILSLVSEFDCYDFGKLPVCENSAMMGEIFTEAAMALAEGETSQPILDESGAWIIRCLGNIEPGAVPMEEIHDALAEIVLESGKSEEYYLLTQQWMEEADVQTYPELIP